MSEQLCIKTNFTAGQVSEKIFGRADLSIFENGAKALENVTIHPTGGLSRRKGLKFLDSLPAKTRLISFEFNTEETYILALYDCGLKAYKNGECVATIETPWAEKYLFELNFTQSADTLLVVHPDLKPKKLSRISDEEWIIEDWKFHEEEGMVYCPYFNFYQKNVEVVIYRPSTHNYRFVADQDIFHAGYLGTLIKVHNGCLRVREICSPREIYLDGLKLPDSIVTTSDWEEEVFTEYRGWPRSVTFHQDRMVIGGSKTLPNRLWLSKSSDLFNFDVGKGLDDDSIDFAILSDQVNAITAVVSSRHLLVFTTGAEWMVTGEPLAPASIQITRQTNIGSYTKNLIIPQQIDGATVFVSHNGKQLRELLYTDTEQAYQSTDLTLLAQGIISKPQDACFSASENVLYMVLEEGDIACITSYRTEQVTAWSKINTKGKFISGCISGDNVYFCICRNNRYFIEVLDEDFYVDCALEFNKDAPAKIFDGLDLFEGGEVMVVADGFNAGLHEVINGRITLLDEAKNIKVGYPYSHRIEPLPYMVDSAKPYPPKAFRVISSIFRIIDTGSFRVDIGNGYFDVPLRRMSDEKVLDSAPVRYSGDIRLRSLGWIRDMNVPMWSIQSNEPLPFTLLSVVNEIKLKN